MKLVLWIFKIKQDIPSFTFISMEHIKTAQGTAQGLGPCSNHYSLVTPLPEAIFYKS